MYIGMFVCYTNNHIRTCRGGGKSSALSSEEKTGELEEIAVIFSVDQHESCWCGDQMDSPGTVPYWELQGSEVPGKGQWRVEGWLLHRHRQQK